MRVNVVLLVKVVRVVIAVFVEIAVANGLEGLIATQQVVAQGILAAMPLSLSIHVSH